MELAPVFGNFCSTFISYSSDEGFEGSTSESPLRGRTTKFCHKWKSPVKTRVDPYFLESSPISLQKRRSGRVEHNQVQEITSAAKKDARFDVIEQLEQRNLHQIIFKIFSFCGDREIYFPTLLSLGVGGFIFGTTVIHNQKPLLELSF